MTMPANRIPEMTTAGPVEAIVIVGAIMLIALGVALFWGDIMRVFGSQPASRSGRRRRRTRRP